MLLTEPHRYNETACHEIPSLPNTQPSANPLQKMVKLSARSSCVVCRFDLQQHFPHELSNSPNIPHSSLEITVIIRSNFPVSHYVPTQEVLDLAEYLQVLPRRSGSCHISSWPLCSCVSQDLLCFSQHTSSRTRGVRGIK